MNVLHSTFHLLNTLRQAPCLRASLEEIEHRTLALPIHGEASFLPSFQGRLRRGYRSLGPAQRKATHCSDDNMSADLFAEFSNNTKPPKSLPPIALGHVAQNQEASQSTDSIDFFSTSVAHQPLRHESMTSQPSQHVQSEQIGSFGGFAWSGSLGNAATIGRTEDEDGWGDFEVAEERPGVEGPSEASNAKQAKTLVSNETRTQPRIIRASTIDLMSNNYLKDEQAQTSSPTNQSKAPSHPVVKKKWDINGQSSDPNVLFDVDDFELQEGDGGFPENDDGDDDDDFGDFEDAPPTLQQPTTASPPSTKATYSMPSMDLLSLDDAPQSQNSSQPSSSKSPKGPPSFAAASKATSQPLSTWDPNQMQTMASFPKGATMAASSSSIPSPSSKLQSKSQPTKPSHNAPPRKMGVRSPLKTAPSPSLQIDEDKWAAWDDPSGQDIQAAQKSSNILTSGDDWNWEDNDIASKAAGGQSTKHDSNAMPPPINVPPPSVLLSAFPDLLSSGDALFKPATGQSASVKERVLSNPKAAEFLAGYLSLATTAGRVIAGRKHRWHRDKILAKSMSISASGSKGMKLAGIDKTQTTREDREAEDVIAAWRERVGRIRSAVAAVNAADTSNLKVPELSVSPHITTAKQVPLAPKQCVICGLKRDERVAKVDVEMVEDSFGEWWVDHWGHRSCRNFWIEHEQNLRQR